MSRDPIINPASNASGSPSNNSSGRIKSVSGGGPAFTPAKDLGSSAPAPASPYRK